MNKAIDHLALLVSLVALTTASTPHIEQAPVSVPRLEVIRSTATPAVQGADDTPDVSTSDATAEAQDAVEPEAVSFESNTSGPTPLTEEPSVTFNCPTCKGEGIYFGALCPTCDGASAATLTKDGVTFSEQGWKQPAPTPPPVPAYPVRAAVSGRWIQVPTYGPLGRQRGFRWQWQPYQAPRQYQYQTRYYMNSCPTGTCGR